MKIRRIMCCCGNGVGTSMMMQMTVEDALDILHVHGVEVAFGPLSDAHPMTADLFVVSQEVLDTLGDLPAVGLEDLMDAEQAAEALRGWFL